MSKMRIRKNLPARPIALILCLLYDSILAQSRVDYYQNSYQPASDLPHQQQQQQQQEASSSDESPQVPASQHNYPSWPTYGQPHQNLASHPNANNFAINLPNPSNVIQPSSFNQQYVSIKPPGFPVNNQAPNGYPEGYFSWPHSPSPGAASNWPNVPNPNAQIPGQASSENVGAPAPAWTHMNQPNKAPFIIYPNSPSVSSIETLYKVPHLPAESVEVASTVVPPSPPFLPSGIQPHQPAKPEFSFGNYAQQQGLQGPVTFVGGPQNGQIGVYPQQGQIPPGNYAQGPNLPGFPGHPQPPTQPSAVSAPQPPPAQVEVDQNNLQRYAQYLEILQKHYGIKMPGQSTSAEINSPSMASNSLPVASPSPNPNPAPNGYPMPGSQSVPHPAPQPQPSNFNSWPNFPSNYINQGMPAPQPPTQPGSAMSIVNNPMPSLPSMPENMFNSFGNYANIQQPQPPPQPQPQPQTQIPHGQTYIYPPQPQPPPSPRGEYMGINGHGHGQVHILPETHKPAPITPAISYPQYTWTTSPPTTTTTPMTTYRPPTRPSLERGEASTHRPQPSPTTASTTSIQALTQQIRRLPAVLYVDSRNPESRKTENLLRDTYGLPLVAFYVDKIDKPKVVERHLQQLTAHKGLPYLFICGTFIGSQQHIDNYHINKQIPQLVEYVCGDEKKRKAKKSKKNSS